MGTVTMLCLLAVVLIIVAAIVLRQRRAAGARWAERRAENERYYVNWHENYNSGRTLRR